ncbi:hypothetical protein GCM10011531_04810 [Aquaticitalea lipolytica]|uniref:Uncharacterized protein n=1 Tax=Aquaticitalea lipolytica TaxID=1247562 RepID=A0A8J2TLL0_9FLAO|nr:hypothetical protein [Aquaticitalea lipolytica]GFZ78311.1 hypothetical protein GCM10011531_04810 [Aquaticitalea lipolytica]
MTKKKVIYIILAISSLFLIASIYTNYKMYIHYSNASGKTQALFGINELLQYGYKKLFGVFPLIGLILSLYISRNKDIRFMSLFAALVSLITVIFSVFSIWRVFI